MKRLEQFLSLALGIYIALFPWQTRFVFSQPQLGIQSTEYGTLCVYATDLLLLAIIIGVAYLERLSRGSKKVWIAAFVLVIIAFGSVLLPDRVDVVLASLRLILLGLAVMYVIQQPWVSLRFICLCFVAGAVLQSVIGIGQFLTQSTFVIPGLGLAAHDPAVSGTSVIVQGGMRWLRAYGSLPHPNILGGYLAVAWLVAFGLYLRAYESIRAGLVRWGRENVRRHLEGKKWYARQAWQITGLIIILGVLTTGLLLTFSRSAWLGMGVGWFLTLAALLVVRWPGGIWLWAKWSFFAGLVASVVILAAPGAFFGRVTASSVLDTVSISERQQQYQDAIALLKNSPLRGVGLGNMVVATYDQLSWNRYGTAAYQPVHNIYLLATVELGIIGGLVFFTFLITAYWVSLTNLVAHTSWVAVAATGALTCLLVIGLLDHYLWDLGVGVALLWFVVGLGSREGGK